MKGRKVPPRPEIAAIVHNTEPLTMEGIRATLDRETLMQIGREAPTMIERMPEPTPYQRGHLDRYQDRKRKRW